MVEFINLQNRFKNIEGQVHPCEGYALYLLAAGGPGEGAIVELGSHAGHATCWLAEGSRKVNREKVIAVGDYKPAGSAPSKDAPETPQPEDKAPNPETLPQPEPPHEPEPPSAQPPSALQSPQNDIPAESPPSAPVPSPASPASKNRFTGPLAELASLGAPGASPPEETPPGSGAPPASTQGAGAHAAPGDGPPGQESYINMGGPLARENSAPGAPPSAEARKGDDLKLEEGPFAALKQKADEATSERLKKLGGLAPFPARSTPPKLPAGKKQPPKPKLPVLEPDPADPRCAKLLANINAQKLTDRVKVYAGSYTRACQSWSGGIRVLYIHGEIDYDTCKQQVKLWGEHLVRGGVVVLQDIKKNEALRKFYQEQKESHGPFAELFTILGLGVLEKRI